MKPESCLDAAELCWGDTGDGGEFPLIVPLVPGRSYLFSTLDWRNALKTGCFGCIPNIPPSPNDVDVRFTNFASVLVVALLEKIPGCSEMNASFGNVSMTYAGGPISTPQRLWRGAAAWRSEMSFRRCWRGKGFGGLDEMMTSESRSTQTKSSSGNSILSYRRSMPTMYGHGAYQRQYKLHRIGKWHLTSMADNKRAGNTGTYTPSHCIGYSKLMRPLETSSSIEVYEERRMIRDSASMNSNRVTIFGMDIARNSA